MSLTYNDAHCGSTIYKIHLSEDNLRLCVNHRKRNRKIEQITTGNYTKFSASIQSSLPLQLQVESHKFIVQGFCFFLYLFEIFSQGGAYTCLSFSFSSQSSALKDFITQTWWGEGGGWGRGRCFSCVLCP